MELSLCGRTALVCGASKGIGRAAAEELAGLGARVVALARSREALDELVQTLPGEGHLALCQDLADLPGLEAGVAEMLKTVGAVEILVNNTGGPPPGPILEAPPEAFLAGIQRHLLASSGLVRWLLPGMKERGYGRILNVISTSVRVPLPGLGVSNSVRGAMASWAKTLSLELAPLGITVNNILPGFTDTERLRSLIASRAEEAGCSPEEMAERWRATVPAGRFGEASELGAVIAFLASPAAAYVNGVSIPVDGGRTGCI